VGQADRKVTGNRILDALPQDEFDALTGHMSPVSLSLKQVLYRTGDPIEFLYFPVSGVISIISSLNDGTSIEVGTVGNEGIVGLPALLGGRISPNDVIAEGEGAALRVSAKAIQGDFHRCEQFRALSLRFAGLFLEEVSQTAACNARHRLGERCARWLLMMCDRLKSDHFPLTHEFLSMLLGVQRTGVTAAALNLQRRGLIRYAHGHVSVLDRAGLEAAACGCYNQVKVRLESFPGQGVAE
jgi:CRP-like cAMP-binding protein